MIKIDDTVKCRRKAAHAGRIGTVVSDWPGDNYDFGVRLEGDEDKAAPTPFKRKELRKLRWFGRLKRWWDNQEVDW